MKHSVNLADVGQFPNNRRQSTRFQLTAAVRFQWQSTDGGWHEGSGYTRDISKAGAFIESGTLPPIGSAVKMVATLPTQWRTDGALRLGGGGDVRHVRQLDASGFGVSVVLRLEVSMAKG